MTSAVIDATTGKGAAPVRIRRWTPGDVAEPGIVSSHALALPQRYALGEALGQLPGSLVLAVDIAESGNGVGLTPAVAAAVPEVIKAVLEELGRCW
jgi:hydrogenase maturation protease